MCQQKQETEVVKNMKTEKPYVIVRTYSAGVFAGTLESRKGQEVKLSKARRLWIFEEQTSMVMVFLTAMALAMTLVMALAIVIGGMI